MSNDSQQSTTQLTETGATTRIEPPRLQRGPLPALTIIHHPALRRIGDRVLLGELVAGREAKISRHAPRFAPPRHPRGAALGDPHISRTPFALRLLDSGSIELDPGESRTRIAIDGERVTEPRRFSPSQLERGVILELANRIALLLHVYTRHDDTETGDLGLVGYSAAMLRVREDIHRIASLDVPVLVRGETGTGKELVASAIHATSARRGQPLVSVNLAALPAALAAAELFGASRGAFTGATRAQEGYFRRAHGGTLFLDEIGETAVDVQVMLLRALETGEIHALGAQRAEQVDVRIVAATDADLDAMVRQGRFRAPLLHRLAAYEIHIPPLRARRDDIGRLLVHFLGLDLAEIGDAERLDRDSAEPWLPMALMTRLVRYDWPGNVRQLRNAARQIVIGSRRRAEAALPDSLLRQLAPARPVLPEAPDAAAPGGQPEARRPGAAARPGRRKPSNIAEQEIIETLRAQQWNIKAAAAALGISRTSLYHIIESSERMRTAGSLDADEIRACYREARGDLDVMVDRLCVSKAALRRRIKELGLA